MIYFQQVISTLELFLYGHGSKILYGVIYINIPNLQLFIKKIFLHV